MTIYVRVQDSSGKGRVYSSDDEYYNNEYNAIRELQQIIRDSEDSYIEQEFESHPDFIETTEASISVPAPNIYEIGNGGGLYMKNGSGSTVHVSKAIPMKYEKGQVIEHPDETIEAIVEARRVDGLPEYKLRVQSMDEFGKTYRVDQEDIENNPEAEVMDYSESSLA